uniref:Secreted RxLR effector protein 35 n=1 Tax=Plasmopara viticola TaxID=143451 RepID=RLR35_PLAVT|nr:RecName: Full=Secreted RxLR effector protein 35; Flags: Precursor [Plasmopara viticola]UWV67306.1 avirulence-like protein 77 [Plasmopara viticola]
MRGAYYIIIALCVVASSQVAAGSDRQLQIYEHGVMPADNAVVKTLAKRFLRGSRVVHDDLANEERSFHPFLVDMIEEGIKEMSHAAEIVEEMPLAGKVVEEVPHATEGGQQKMDKGAEEAFEKHVEPSGHTATIQDTSRDISTQEVIQLSPHEWESDLSKLKPFVVLNKHRGRIEPVKDAFAAFCDEGLKPTTEETSIIWSMLGWNLARKPKGKHRQHLIAQARRGVLLDLRIVRMDESLWNKWMQLPKPLRMLKLNNLLNMHYQRWVHLFNIFQRRLSEIIGPPPKLKVAHGDTTDTSKALALHTHSNMQSSTPSEPLNAASTFKVERFVWGANRPKRTTDGNTGTISLPTKPTKTHRLKPLMPRLTESTTSSDLLVPTKRMRLSFGGTRSAFAPYKDPKEKLLAPSSTALTHKDIDLDLSLGGIYGKRTDKAL